MVRLRRPPRAIMVLLAAVVGFLGIMTDAAVNVAARSRGHGRADGDGQAHTCRTLSV